MMVHDLNTVLTSRAMACSIWLQNLASLADCKIGSCLFLKNFFKFLLIMRQERPSRNDPRVCAGSYKQKDLH